jgi:hypothetical protein
MLTSSRNNISTENPYKSSQNFKNSNLVSASQLTISPARKSGQKSAMDYNSRISNRKKVKLDPIQKQSESQAHKSLMMNREANKSVPMMKKLFV